MKIKTNEDLKEKDKKLLNDEDRKSVLESILERQTSMAKEIRKYKKDNKYLTERWKKLKRNEKYDRNRYFSKHL